MPKRKYWEPGNYVSIPIEHDLHSYGVVTNSIHMAFLDYIGNENLSVSQIHNLEILFEVPVMKYAIGKNGWSLAGHIELTESFVTAPEYFKKDILSGRLSIVDAGFENERSATLDECSGLERAAVWDPVHLVSRLSDHFSGNENKWVKSLALE